MNHGECTGYQDINANFTVVCLPLAINMVRWIDGTVKKTQRKYSFPKTHDKRE